MIYDNYKTRLQNIVAQSKNKQNLSKGLAAIGGISGVMPKNRLEAIQEQHTFSEKSQLNAQPLSNILHPDALKNATLGVHKDFAHLKGTGNTENHYIVSMFVDIDGSTNLFRKYDQEDNYSITNTIQSAAIHTIIALGGHVQRLQGDGVFAYFGGRGISHAEASKQAVLAASLFTYFMDNDLKDVFADGGVEDIKTKIGIDLGYNEDVLWATFGLLHIHELTTLSLHTSLASKLMGKASRNGINVGQHIKDNFPGGWYAIISEDERYIWKDPAKQFWYTQYRFNWYQFLVSQPFIQRNPDGKLYIRQQQPAIHTPQRNIEALGTLASSNKPYLW